MQTPEKSSQLINHALGVTKDWYEKTGEHLNLVVHYLDGDLVLAILIPIKDADREQGVLILNRRIVVTLKKLILDGVDELTVSYEGYCIETHTGVLVVSYFSRESEMTWSANLTPRGEVLEWQMINPSGGALVDLYRKAEIHLTN